MTTLDTLRTRLEIDSSDTTDDVLLERLIA
jgi:hypothetical protein